MSCFILYFEADCRRLQVRSLPGNARRFLVDCRNLLCDSDATSTKISAKGEDKSVPVTSTRSLPHIRDTQTPTTSAFNATALLHTTN
jgi:hypothetical protein